MTASAEPDSRAPARPRARLGRGLEWAAVLFLVVAALVPRSRDLGGTWDRELEGFQGSCFAAFAVNYARLGLWRYGGYPAFNVDLPRDPDDVPFLYPNHPPLVPFVCYATLRAIGPEGWDTAWREGRPPPEGTERALRLPFLLGHVALLFALWGAVRRTGGARLALLTLAVAATAPILILYGALVNFENLLWPPLLFGVGLFLQYLVERRTRDLLLAGAGFCASACVTFSAAFFVPPLVLQALLRRGWRTALQTGVVLSAGALLPAMVHGALVRRSLPPALSESVLGRAQQMLSPLFDGSYPLGEWCRRQLVRANEFFTWPVLVLALAGLVVLAVRARRQGRSAPPSPGPALLVGGLCILFAFYRHTFDGAGARDGQTVFQFALAPGIAVLAAVALDALAAPLHRLRGGESPLVALCALVLLPAVARANAVRRDWREPGPNDEPPGTRGPAAPLPATAGREIAQVLPAGAVGIYPKELAYNSAVSYYAWRTLVPASPETYDLALLRVKDAYGLGDAPRYVLLPLAPPSFASAAVERTRTILASQSSKVAASDRWELWEALPASPAPGD